VKILFVISSLGSGGAERVVVNLANYLTKRHQVVIATFSNESSFYQLDQKVKHLKLDLLKESKNVIETIFNSIKRVLTLSNLIKKENPDVVVSFMTHTNFLTILAGKIARKPVVFSERIAYDFYGKRINFLKKVLYPLGKALVVQTKEDAKNYPFVKNVKVIPNPISFDVDGVGKKEKMVLAVGRLEKQKGFDSLIEVFSTIDTDYELLIVGEGSQRASLEALIEKFGAKNIKLLGRREDIWQLYNRAAIFVLSSQREGFPNVLIEAMACGCGVVSYDCPYGPSEIIQNGKNGLLVPNQNKKELKKAIELLMEREELRNNLGQNAMLVQKRFSIEKIGGVWEEVLHECR